MLTPTLNLPQPTVNSAPAKAASPAPAAPAAAAMPAAAAAPAPSTTVSLSPQAMSLAAAPHPAPPSSAGSSAAPAAAPVAHESSIYESLKNGISTAFTDVEDAISGGAHAVVDGVETALSTAHDVAKGIVELPFAAVSKAADAAGALIDRL